MATSNRNYRLGLYEKAMPAQLSWGEKLAFAKQCGFDFLELSVDESEQKLARLQFGDREISELHRTMDGEGIYFESI